MMTVQEQVDALDQAHFDKKARGAADDLACRYSAYTELTPGDGTLYRISIVIQNDGPKPRYWVATQFGPMYEMNADVGDTHWSYVADHWLRDMKSSQEWTARVLARFLNALRTAMRSSG